MRKVIIVIVMCFAFLLMPIACSSPPVPKEYDKVLTKLVNQVEKIKSIPLEKKNLNTGDGKYGGIISYERRAEYYRDNKMDWHHLLSDLEKTKSDFESTEWYDDLLFCKAFAYIVIFDLDRSEQMTDRAISAINSYIAYDGGSNIEAWTKSRLRKVIWDSLVEHFDESAPEKVNLIQFFYLANASLYANRKNDYDQAIEYYSKAVDANPNSFWAKQAKMQIEILTRVNNGPNQVQ